MPQKYFLLEEALLLGKRAKFYFGYGIWVQTSCSKSGVGKAFTPSALTAPLQNIGTGPEKKQARQVGRRTCDQL